MLSLWLPIGSGLEKMMFWQGHQFILKNCRDIRAQVKQNLWNGPKWNIKEKHSLGSYKVDSMNDYNNINCTGNSYPYASHPQLQRYDKQTMPTSYFIIIQTAGQVERSCLLPWTISSDNLKTNPYHNILSSRFFSKYMDHNRILHCVIVNHN